MFIVLPFSDHRKALRRTGLRQSPRCDKPERRLSGRRRVSCQLVCRSSGGAGPAQHLRRKARQMERGRPPHPAGKVAVPRIHFNQETVQYPQKAHAPRGRGKPYLRDRCRVVRLGDLKEEKETSSRKKVNAVVCFCIEIQWTTALIFDEQVLPCPTQRAKLDALLYNNPLEYAQLVLIGEIEHYLSLGCDHGRMED